MTSKARYTSNFFTHQMRRVPRSVDQFPAKLKIKARQTRHRFSFKNPIKSEVVVTPLVDELQKIRDPHGFPKFSEEEIKHHAYLGPLRRLVAIGEQMTELIRYERIEGKFLEMEDTRLYTELLLQLAVANGDRHRPTMELVNFYIHEKDLIPKLFHVLVPRYIGGSGLRRIDDVDDPTRFPSPTSLSLPTRFTDFYRLPPENLGVHRQENHHLVHMRAILELRGNPWPSVVPKRRDQSGLITNVLMRAAKDSRELAARKRAIESVKSKVADVAESMEAPSAAAMAMTSAEAEHFQQALVADNPYESYAREAPKNDDDRESPENENDRDIDDELEWKLKNLDLNLR